MDNIAGKTISIKEKGNLYTVKVPTRPAEAFSLANGAHILLYQDFLDAECTIVATTVKEFICIKQPQRTYMHKVDKCGWNVYRVSFEFNTGQSFGVSTENEKELEQDVCEAINQRFGLELEPSNLDFLK